MIKRIIFDVDNTLLDTYKDCINAYAEFLKDYPNIKPKMFYDVIGEFELKGIGFDKDEHYKYVSTDLYKNGIFDDNDNEIANNVRRKVKTIDEIVNLKDRKKNDTRF